MIASATPPIKPGSGHSRPADRPRGKWQRLLLDALRSAPLVTLGAMLPDPADASGRSAVHRAARLLAARGRCELALLYTEEPDRRLVTVACRPGFVFKGGRTLADLSVKRSRCAGGAHLQPFVGSLRDLATQNRVSVATIRRDLAAARGAEEGGCPS
ncbi:MAG TPA: hypothetical protein VFW33_07140 [Gemmataceae bacterium]|nr:hypothetical protein [Gemmataceae bacterium]